MFSECITEHAPLPHNESLHHQICEWLSNSWTTWQFHYWPAHSLLSPTELREEQIRPGNNSVESFNFLQTIQHYFSIMSNFQFHQRLVIIEEFYPTDISCPGCCFNPNPASTNLNMEGNLDVSLAICSAWLEGFVLYNNLTQCATHFLVQAMVISSSIFH